MRKAIIIVGVLSFLITYSLALQIGAFNTGIYGKTKSSKPEVVAIFKEVIIYYNETHYIAILNIINISVLNDN